MTEKKTADAPLHVPTAESNGHGEVLPVYKEKPVVNIDGVTARDMLDTDNDARFKLYARGVVVSLPDHWGEGDPGRVQTYLKMKVRHLAQINEVFAETMLAAKPDFIEGFAVDVWDVTVEEMTNLKGKRVAELVARYVKRVPENWGAAHDAETYLSLPHPVWLKVQEITTEALENLGKNLNGR